MPNKKSKRSNRPSYLKDLTILFSIPVIVAVIAIAIIYVPQLMARPNYDFIYYSCMEYRCDYGYYVDQTGHVAKKKLRNSLSDMEYTDRTPTIYYYDVGKDASRTITFEEAGKLQLNTSSRSPDGYAIVHESSESGFLFWGNSASGWYLKNGAAKKEVDLQNYSSDYFDKGKFLGWIEK